MVGIIDMESKDRIIDTAGVMEPSEHQWATIEPKTDSLEVMKVEEDLGDETCEMKSLLNEIGWSQAHFSRRIGVSEQTLCNWMKPGEHQGGYRVGLAYLRLVERLLNG